MFEHTAVDEKELSKLLAAAYPPASATFINDLPPDWQMNIDQIGCKFVYDDGHNDNKSASVNIPGGGQQATLVATYSGCCRAYFVVMRVRDSSGGVQSLANSTTVGAGYCGGNLRWHLVPKSQITKGAPGVARAIELRIESDQPTRCSPNE
jgi:hypothetical protein